MAMPPGPIKPYIKEQQPVKAHSLCCVCAMNFDDYFQHLESRTHKNHLTTHKRFYEQFDAEVMEMTLEFETEKSKVRVTR